MSSSCTTTVIQADEFRRWMPPLRNWDERFTLFYDETNNIRRLRLSAAGLNAPGGNYFVLAGVALRAGQKLPPVEGLRGALRLQANAPELKARHVAEDDFEAMLASPRLQIFLSWLLDQGLLVHYSGLNVLYWSLIDIVESLQGCDALVALNHRVLKNELFELASRRPGEFLSLLHAFAYPNVQRSQVRPFLTAVANFLARESVRDRNAAATLLKERLRAAAGVDELAFLHDNQDGELIRDFSGHFLRGLYVLKSATHIFDEETFVQQALLGTEVRDGRRRVDYRFANSRSEAGIQLSDVMANLLGKYFTFLQASTLATLLARKAAFSSIQRHNMALLRELVDRSDAVSDAFCHIIAPLDTEFKNASFLHDQPAPGYLA